MPLTVIQEQIIGILKKANLPFVNLGDTSPDNLASVIKDTKPIILLTSIEVIARLSIVPKTKFAKVIVRPEVQASLRRSRIKINYICLDEAQVASILINTP